MIDILDRARLFAILGRLQWNDKPQFGAMSPQHMVEHLAFAVSFSNGKAPQQRHYAKEKEEKTKAFVLNTENDLPIGFKSPVLPIDELPILKCSDLAGAVDKLKIELKEFDRYFSVRPFAKPINPTMGELNYQEWITFHNRHFAHHFKQFRLV